MIWDDRIYKIGLEPCPEPHFNDCRQLSTAGAEKYIRCDDLSQNMPFAYEVSHFPQLELPALFTDMVGYEMEYDGGKLNWKHYLAMGLIVAGAVAVAVGLVILTGGTAALPFVVAGTGGSIGAVITGSGIAAAVTSILGGISLGTGIVTLATSS